MATAPYVPDVDTVRARLSNSAPERRRYKRRSTEAEYICRSSPCRIELERMPWSMYCVRKETSLLISPRGRKGKPRVPGENTCDNAVQRLFAAHRPCRSSTPA